MNRFKIIAREVIVGIYDDFGLWALDGYAELIGECDASVPIETVKEEMISLIKERHPKNRFELFSLILLDAA